MASSEGMGGTAKAVKPLDLPARPSVTKKSDVYQQIMDLQNETNVWVSPRTAWLDERSAQDSGDSGSQVSPGQADDEGAVERSTAVTAGFNIDLGEPQAEQKAEGSRLGGLSSEESWENDENFIQDDDEEGDDDEAWDVVTDKATVAYRHTSAGRQRPDSAMQAKRPPLQATSVNPEMDRFRLPVGELDPEEAKELRIESMYPSFVAVYHPLVATKIATGGSRLLLQYLQRGYPELCVESIENGVRSLSKLRRKDVQDMSEAALRLVVMGNYCATLLMQAGEFGHAKEILNKIQLLTSEHMGDFRRKCLFRVWTLCNLGILHSKMGMAIVGYEYLEMALDHVTRNNHLGGQAVFVCVRSAFFGMAGQFSRALSDCQFCKDVIKRLEKDKTSLLGPSPNAAIHHLRLVMNFNAALASLCQHTQDMPGALQHAEAAWKEAQNAKVMDNKVGESEKLIRKEALRLRDALAREGGIDIYEDHIQAIRTASMVPAVGFDMAAEVIRIAKSAGEEDKENNQAQPENLGPNTDEQPNTSETMDELKSAIAKAGIGSEANNRVQIEESVEMLRGLMYRAEEMKMQVDSGIDIQEGTRSGIQDACRRHIRCSWLVHSPVVAITVSKPLLQFLKALDDVFATNKLSDCMHEIERLVEALQLPAVQQALGNSSERDVYLGVCNACNKFGVKSFQLGRIQDGLVFFGSAMSIACRPSVSGLKSVLRAWTMDNLAYGHYCAEQYDAALTSLDAARDELLSKSHRMQTQAREKVENEHDASDSAETPKVSDDAEPQKLLNDSNGATDDSEASENDTTPLEPHIQEMLLSIGAHRIQVLFRMGRILEALDQGVSLMQELRAGPASIFKVLRPPAVCLSPAQVYAAWLRSDRLSQLEPGRRFGEQMALWVPEVAGKPLLELNNRRRSARRIATHSLKYVLAHVALVTAASAASLGREDDARSLLKYAQQSGDLAFVSSTRRKKSKTPNPPVDESKGMYMSDGITSGDSDAEIAADQVPFRAIAWDGESGPEALKTQVQEAVALMDFVNREGVAAMSSAGSVLVLGASQSASRPSSATPSRSMSRSMSRPSSAHFSRPSSAFERISIACPKGSTANLLSRPQSAVSRTSSQHLSGKLPAARRRPASAPGIHSPQKAERSGEWTSYLSKPRGRPPHYDELIPESSSGKRNMEKRVMGRIGGGDGWRSGPERLREGPSPIQTQPVAARSARFAPGEVDGKRLRPASAMHRPLSANAKGLRRADRPASAHDRLRG